MLSNLIDLLKADRRKLVFTEGNDLRILEAANRILKENLLDVILLGNVKEIEGLAVANEFDISNATIMDPMTSELYPAMVKELSTIRKGKRDEAKVAENCRKANYFGTMLVKMGFADGLLGGATYSTADTVRPALQIIKTAPGNSIVSSSFLLIKPNATKDMDRSKILMGDTAINISPDAKQLSEIALQTARTARRFGLEPKIAMLSYSSHGSGKGPTVDLVREATEIVKATKPDFIIDGELQFDSAYSSVVSEKKAPNSELKGEANTFIFPDINAGNIGYKIAQRLGGYGAYGPILQGMNAPINDLSRGCNTDEVYKMAIITAALK